MFISSTVSVWQPLQILAHHKLWTHYVIFTSIVTVFFWVFFASLIHNFCVFASFFVLVVLCTLAHVGGGTGRGIRGYSALCEAGMFTHSCCLLYTPVK